MQETLLGSKRNKGTFKITFVKFKIISVRRMKNKISIVSVKKPSKVGGKKVAWKNLDKKELIIKNISLDDLSSKGIYFIGIRRKTLNPNLKCLPNEIKSKISKYKFLMKIK